MLDHVVVLWQFGMVQDAYQLSIIICFNTEYNISIVTSTVKFDAKM
jgi:hypothetical protein